MKQRSEIKWVTSKENQRNNVVTQIIVNEIRELNKTKKYSQQQLAEKYDVSRSTIYYIINNKYWKNNVN